mmetsp:Transcript_48408/g.138311  ORF Transcript_48408/g.138311 Transcript_48408/m.138311 type:complete len:253 (+) Transcript_48408:1119-1877(+)
MRGEALVREARELKEDGAVGGDARGSRHRKEVAQQQDRRLPDSPPALVLRQLQGLAGHCAEELGVPERVRVAHGQEDLGGVQRRELRGEVPDGLSVGPLAIGRLAGDVPRQALRVEGRHDARKQVGRAAKDAVGLLAAADPLARFHRQHHVHAIARQGRAPEVLQRVHQHLLILLVVWQDDDVGHVGLALRARLPDLPEHRVPVLAGRLAHPVDAESAADGEVRGKCHREGGQQRRDDIEGSRRDKGRDDHG